MKYRPFIHSSDSGFSLLELIVALGLSMLVGAIALSHFQSTQRMVRYDMERTSLNQNLRSALDIIGMNVRLAGENLPGFFPAILLTDNGSSDTFTIRRSILDENLIGCLGITSGTTSSIVFGDDSSTEAECSYTNKAEVLAAWTASRVSQGGTGLGFIYDRGTFLGEWFEWSTELDTGAVMSISPLQPWVNNYNPLHTFAYVLEEWEFSLNGDTLQMVVDNDTANPINVVNGISAFNVTVELNDTTSLDSFAAGDNWSQVALINVSLTGQESSAGQMVSRTMNGSFFPRNVLSN